MTRIQEAEQGFMSPAGHSRVPGAVRAPFCTATGACGASFSLCAGWQTAEIHIQNQESLLWIPVANGLTFASGDGTDRCTSLLHIGIGDPIPGRRDGCLVRKGLEPPCVCSCGIRSNTGIDLRDGMTTTQNAHEACEQLVVGSFHEAFLVQLDLVVPPQLTVVMLPRR